MLGLGNGCWVPAHKLSKFMAACVCSQARRMQVTTPVQLEFVAEQDYYGDLMQHIPVPDAAATDVPATGTAAAGAPTSMQLPSIDERYQGIAGAGGGGGGGGGSIRRKRKRAGKGSAADATAAAAQARSSWILAHSYGALVAVGVYFAASSGCSEA